MKKLSCILLSVCLLLALAACGSGDVQQEPAANGNGAVQSGGSAPSGDQPAEPGFVFTYKGIDISANMPAADILADLGEPMNYSESPSCAFEGLDKTYYFGSFFLETYPMPDGDYVYRFWLADDTVTTAEGIYIGAPEAQVKTAYGEDSYNGTNAYVVTKGDSKLTVILENGVVSQITYDAIVK